MKKIYYTILAVMGLGLASCAFEDVNPFETSSAERVKATVENATKVLTGAPAGWVMQVYPESTVAYGGFNLLVNFTEDGMVTVASEYSDYEQVKSTWRIDQSAGAVLCFDTYNEIFHYLSDPGVNAGSGTGYGFEGDYDYLIISAEKDKVVLKGKKSGNYSVLRPLPAGTDWDEYLDAIDEASEVALGFSKRILLIGEKSFKVSLNYRKFIIDTIVDDALVEVDAPFVVTTDGIVFYQPVEIDGAVLDAFVIGGEDGTDLISTSDESVRFTPYIAPLNEAFATGDWFMTKSNMSASMLAEFNKFTNGVYSGEGETVIYFAMCVGSHMISTYSSTWGMFMFVDTGYAAQWACTATLEGEDKVTLAFDGSGQGDASYYASHYGSAHLNALTKTFVVTADNVKAPSELTITEVGNPDNYIKFASDMVQY